MTLRFLFVICASVAANLLISSSAFSAIYYVDKTNPQCSDSGSGTTTTPYCTISKAASVALAGDTINVAPATYTEQVTPAKSGTSGAPITFITPTSGCTTYDGATVTGQQYGFKLSGRSWITIQGFTVSNTTGSGFYASSASGVNLTCNHIVGTGDRGIYMSGISDSTLSNNFIEQTVNYGIYIVNASAIVSHNITLNNNHVKMAGQQVSGYTRKGIYLNGTLSSLVEENLAEYNTDSGIYLVNSANANNVVHNTTNNNARGYTRAAPGIDINSGSSNNTLDRNISHDNEDSGIQFYNSAQNNLAVNNLCYNNGDHGIDTLNSPGQRYINNTVYNNTTAGINVEGSSNTTASSGATLANNISVDNALTNTFGQKGNIRVDSNSISGTTVDYDLVFLSSNGTMMKWGNTAYSSLAAFVTATGMETHGIQASPLWIAPDSADFHLSSGSPAINSGANSSLVNGVPGYDLDNNSRDTSPDRGAYEF